MNIQLNIFKKSHYVPGLVLVIIFSIFIWTVSHWRKFGEKRRHHFKQRKVNNQEHCLSDPELIQEVKTSVLLYPSGKLDPANFEGVDIKGQVGQSQVVDKILEGQTNGFYIEAGSYNGIYISNTLFFALKRNWTGLLVEPNPKVFKNLTTNRPDAYKANICLSSSGTKEMLNLTIPNNLPLAGGLIVKDGENSTERFTVPCYPLITLLEALGNPTVDYLSLDVEGTEPDILLSLPMKKVNIRVLTVEYIASMKPSPHKGLMEDFMKFHGYKVVDMGFHQDLWFTKL